MTTSAPASTRPYAAKRSVAAPHFAGHCLQRVKQPPVHHGNLREPRERESEVQVQRTEDHSTWLHDESKQAEKRSAFITALAHVLKTGCHQGTI